MKLNSYQPSIEEKMAEFDMWVTPSLGEIRDSKETQDEKAKLSKGFALLADLTDNYQSVESCSPRVIADKVIDETQRDADYLSENILGVVINTLITATGKSDNNLQCQFPVHLKNGCNLSSYQLANGTSVPIPRILNVSVVLKIARSTVHDSDFISRFLYQYFQLILSDDKYIEQLWSIGQAFRTQNNQSNDVGFLTLLAITRVRGSVSARQGHIPEELVRNCMEEWGLEPGVDYNLYDASLTEVVDSLGTSNDKFLKKRKYDFIIPYKTDFPGPRLFIQCQFYAGDSGSVSHKVIDQTDSTRKEAINLFPKVIFLELLDGAGYYSSLNRDLRVMISKPMTADFFQLRTAPIKLRRKLQDIKFLTLLEFEHALLKSSDNYNAAVAILKSEGYSEMEISRVFNQAKRRGSIDIVSAEKVSVSNSRIEIARRHCLLDVIANHGRVLIDGKFKGCLLIPGYSPLWGLEQDEVIKAAMNEFPTMYNNWTDSLKIFEDIRWLVDKEYIISK